MTFFVRMKQIIEGQTAFKTTKHQLKKVMVFMGHLVDRQAA